MAQSSIARRRVLPAAALAATLLLAGQAVAGDAWVATYRFEQGQQHCELSLVRSADRAQQAGCGHPTRIWQRLGDGVELLELHPRQGRAVRYAPGDLRTMGREQDWARISALVPASIRESLGSARPAQVDGRAVLRQRGKASDGRAVELDWIPDVDLPALYMLGEGDTRERLALVSLQQMPAERAFAQTSTLQEVDAADAGD